MGVDAIIYFECDSDEPSDYYCPEGFASVHAINSPASQRFREPETATHEVCINQNNRWYGIGYERGMWPAISCVLMSLLASTNVKNVWYTSDHNDTAGEPITREDVLKISDHYMQHACRPYFNRYAHPTPTPQAGA